MEDTSRERSAKPVTPVWRHDHAPSGDLPCSDEVRKWAGIVAPVGRSSSVATASRKDPAVRKLEILEVAARVAVEDGLSRVTAKGVAARVGVRHSLVNHYYSGVDELVAAAFSYAASAEREEIAAAARAAKTRSEGLCTLLSTFLSPDRDPLTILWLDAFRESTRRPPLLRELTRQLELDRDLIESLIQEGIDAGEFSNVDSRMLAMRIVVLLDGVMGQAAVRVALEQSSLDYEAVTDFVVTVIERELSLPPGSLAF